VSDGQLHIIAGKHICGRKLDMRIIASKKDIPFWIIYGICVKCEIVVISNLFFDKKPLLESDFIIDYNKICEDKNEYCSDI
jgi:hypothetical protein